MVDYAKNDWGGVADKGAKEVGLTVEALLHV